MKRNSKRVAALLLAIWLCFYAVGCTDSAASEEGPTLTTAVTVPADEQPSHESRGDPDDDKTVAAGTTGSAATEKSPKNTEPPAYTGSAYVSLDDGVPAFTAAQKQPTAFETYSALDALGRCGVAFACVGRELMPTAERGAIGSVKPSGWHTVKYDCVDGKYLYNRCHLIGYQLTAENANKQNLITGTRYLNVEGMLPFENMVADYIKETGHHVLYRVTPCFTGKNLLADGVRMEAWSVEDKGDGICFDVFCYNVQPGVTIDYATGDSHLASAGKTTTAKPTSKPISKTTVKRTTASKTTAKTTVKTTAKTASPKVSESYVLNTNTKKFHRPSCRHVNTIKAENRQNSSASRNTLIQQGYEPCLTCKP